MVDSRELSIRVTPKGMFLIIELANSNSMASLLAPLVSDALDFASNVTNKVTGMAFIGDQFALEGHGPAAWTLRGLRFRLQRLVRGERGRARSNIAYS